MTNQDTEPFWAQPQNQHTWRHTIEHYLNRLDDAYSALWDLMPAISALMALAILVIVAPHR